MSIAPGGPVFEEAFSYAGQRLTSLQPVGDRDAARSFCFASLSGIGFLSVPADPTSSLQRAHWLPAGCEDFRSVSAIAVHPRATVIAVAEKRLQASVTLYSWPERKLLHRIERASKLQIVDMCWNRTASHFAILSGAPLHNLTVYAVDQSGRLSSSPVVSQKDAPNEHQYTNVSFNPRNPLELCTSGGGHVAFWKIDDTVDVPTLAHVEGRISSPSVRFGCHAWLTTGNVICGSHHGKLFVFDPASGLDSGRSLDLGDSPVVRIVVTKHCVVAACANGQLAFATPDGSILVRLMNTPLLGTVTAMIFTALDTFVLGTDQGHIVAVVLPGFNSTTVVTSDEVSMLAPRILPIEESFGATVAASVLPDQDTLVGVSTDGVLRVRELKTNRVAVRMSVGSLPTAMLVLGPSTVLTAHATGTLRFVDVKTPTIANQLRILTDSEAAEKPPMRLFAPRDADGAVKGTVAIASVGLRLYILNLNSQVAAARLEVPAVFDGINDVSFVPGMPDLIVIAAANSSILLIKIPSELYGAAVGETTLPEISFEDALVNRWRCELPLTHVSVLSYYDGVSFNLIGASTDREVKFGTVDLQVPPKRKDVDTKAIKMPVSFTDHGKRCTFLATIDGMLLVTAGTDGRIVVRNVSALAPQAQMLKGRKDDPAFVVCRHSSFHGGVAGFFLGSKRAVSTGGDGSVVTWSVGGIHSVDSSKKPQSWSETSVKPFNTVQPVARPNPASEEALFFLEQRHKDAEELDRIKHAAHRETVLQRVHTLRDRLREVRAENDGAADDEKVGTEDFLVARDHDRFKKEVQVAVDAMKDEVKWRDLRADYVTHLLRTQCWDRMATKLTPLFGMEKQELCVHSCHERATPQAKLVLLRKLKFLRRIEVNDQAVRKVNELSDLVAKPQDEANPAAPANQRNDVPEERSPLLDMYTDIESKPTPVEQDATEDITPYLYRPMLAFTRHRAITQIALLEAQIGNVTGAFNSKFAELQAQKRSEMDKIRERNLRCSNVQKELDDTSSLFTVAPRPEEMPSTILEVADAEVPADKSYDPTEKRRVALEEAERERWRRQHGNDDSSERALKQWMDGRLEKEIKSLRVDVQEPEFALEGNAKFVPLDERTEDQIRLYKEYEKKLKTRTEEVAARRKFLQAELALLQKDNADCAKRFDGQLEALLLTRLDTMQRCTRIDLYRVKLAQSVALQRDRDVVLGKLERQRAQLSTQVVRADARLKRFRDEFGSVKDDLMKLMAEEKQAERGLRAMPPFTEHEESAERLAKIYANAKKKAAAGGRGARGGKGEKDAKSKAKSDKQASQAQAEAKIAASPDPFAFIDIEADAKLKAAQEEAAAAGAVFAKLEKPEGMPDALWDAFLAYVQDRVDGEREVKQLQLKVGEMAAEEQRLSELYEDLRATASSGRRSSAASASTPAKRCTTRTTCACTAKGRWRWRRPPSSPTTRTPCSSTPATS
jgi:hypothetical protein